MYDRMTRRRHLLYAMIYHKGSPSAFWFSSPSDRSVGRLVCLWRDIAVAIRVAFWDLHVNLKLKMGQKNILRVVADSITANNI